MKYETFSVIFARVQLNRDLKIEKNYFIGNQDLGVKAAQRDMIVQ